MNIILILLLLNLLLVEKNCFVKKSLIRSFIARPLNRKFLCFFCTND